MKQRKTPQDRKREEYANEIRPDIESPHSFRRNWPKKKAFANRRHRRRAALVVTTESKGGDLENVTAGAVAKSAPRGQIKKVLVRSLAEKLDERRRRDARRKASRA